MSTDKIIITLMHHKERAWADFLLKYSMLNDLKTKGFLDVVIKRLPEQNAHVEFAKLPEKVRRLLFFAKPDLVITLDDGKKPIRPFFAIDATEHVAARDHWIQRFPNLVGCAQEGVPGAFVAPRDMPNRPKFAGKTDPVFFFAYDRVVEVHQTPIYIAEWPSSDGKSLDGDKYFADLPPHDCTSIKAMLTFFDLTLDSAIKGRDLSTIMRDRLIVDLRNELRQIGYRDIPKIDLFPRLTANMPDGRMLTLIEMQSWLTKYGLALPTDVPDRIKKRDKCLIVRPTIKFTDAIQRTALIKRIKEKGGDPYTQQPLVFDYLFCRLGPTPFERDANLVIDLTMLKFSDFAEYVKSTWKESPLQHTDFKKIKHNIPIYTLHLTEGMGQVMKNFVRLYAFAADIIVFKDGVLYF